LGNVLDVPLSSPWVKDQKAAPSSSTLVEQVQNLFDAAEYFSAITPSE
jgi:hypothetical protein